MITVKFGEDHVLNSSPNLASFAAVDDRQPVTVWEMLVWAYRSQRADRLGLGRGAASKHRWVDYLSSLDAEIGPTINRDAAAAHRVVIGILKPDDARLVIDAALVGEQPERSTVQPEPRAVLNMDHGGAMHSVRGAWVEVPWIKLTPAEREKLAATDDHGEVERYAVPGGAHRWKYRVDLRPRRRLRRKQRVVCAVTGVPLDTNSGWATGDRLWSPYCPIEYWPDPAYLAMLDAIADRFEEACAALEEAFIQVPFLSRRIVRDGRNAIGKS
ncbi:hypothetical protein FBY14_104216 [Azospirillum brasilense]|nr:hypothetical protein FBY14_104216 [Azospirillum brasilense]